MVKRNDKLKALAQARGMSVNKLMEELSTIALAEFDAETRFLALVAQGDPKEGIAILDKLDSHFSRTKNLK